MFNEFQSRLTSKRERLKKIMDSARFDVTLPIPFTTLLYKAFDYQLTNPLFHEANRNLNPVVLN